MRLRNGCYQLFRARKKLITFGEVEGTSAWPNYLELGLSQKHISELITILTDESLHQADVNSDEVWASLHAWRALGQLKAVEAIPALLDQLYRIDEEDDDWIGEELPEVFAMLGAPAIEELTQYLADSNHGLEARIGAAQSLFNIGKQYPDNCERCKNILKEQLKQYRQNDPTLNGFMVLYLVDMKATEALSLIQDAYRDECVDLSLLGDVEDAEIELGVRETRSTPPPSLNWFQEPDTSYQSSPNDSSTSNTTFVRNGKKIGRNEKCPVEAVRNTKNVV